MNEIEEALQRNQALIDQGQTLVRTARQAREELNGRFERAGLSLATCVAYMHRDATPAPAKARWHEQEAQAQGQVAAEMDRLKMQQPPQSVPTAARRRFVNRQMI
jgi:hypothetical protein